MSNLTAVSHFSFRIPSHEVTGPLNLEKTILSAQTSEPEWVRAGERFYDVEDLEGTPTKYSVSQSGDLDQFELEVRVTGTRSETIVAKLTRHLNQVLGLRDDLPAFHRIFAAETEPLSSTFSKLKGLRLMRGTSLYESLICSILSQNRSAVMWNRTARLLMKYYGQRVEFPDKSTSFLFPRSEVLAAVPARELRAKTSIGYRAKPVVQVSKLISKKKFKLDELSNCQYDEAHESLLNLPGVGPKVADCFLLYGVGMLEAAPVDVWIHRIASRLYFRGRKVSRLKTAEFLRDRYGKWAGYAQLYLFDYARRSGNLGLGNAESRPSVAS
jgi:N-glycosylase/DNA lyase